MPRKKKEETVVDKRNQLVRKSNEMILRSRYNLTPSQNKIILYMISQITKYDTEFDWYEFNIQDFCAVCGIDPGNHGNYVAIKRDLKALHDSSWWILREDGYEELVSWIDRAATSKGEGVVRVRLSDTLRPFLLQLKQQYTEYELLWTLEFKCKYSFRLYELANAIHFDELQPYTRRFTLEEFRKIMQIEDGKYTAYRDFRRRVLEPALEEVNRYTDKLVSFRDLKRGKTVNGIELRVETKSVKERLETMVAINNDLGVLPDQLSFFEDAIYGRSRNSLLGEDK